MFDSLVTAATGTAGVPAVGSWGRVENAACARRLAAMVGLLDAAYAADGSAERDSWCMDNWAAVCAQIGAEAHTTSGVVSGQLLVAVTLRDRYPMVAELFITGLIDYRMVRTIVNRSMLLTGPDACRALDAALARALREWGPMSMDRTEKAIDALVAEIDPVAERRTEITARARGVDVTVEDGGGLATLFATVFATDAAAFDTRLTALAGTVCGEDPRTLDQRRADAMGALAHGADRLACLCDTPGCLAAENPPSTGVIVHLIAHHGTVGPAESESESESARLDGPPPPLFSRPLRELTLVEALSDPMSDPCPERTASTRPAAMIDGRFLPGPVARRAAVGATIVPIVHPGSSPPEPRYVPSKKLADFVRCRDQTCRYPGCKEPATNCDLDHTTPWPYGPTQASNVKCLCRRHHLLKTFWSGAGGWRDRQLPDGTVVWTTPDGQIHVTTPGSRLLFPELCEPTAPAPAIAETVPAQRLCAAGLRMPRRSRTRVRDRAHRIHDEREGNRTAIELESTPETECAEEEPPF